MAARGAVSRRRASPKGRRRQAPRAHAPPALARNRRNTAREARHAPPPSPGAFRFTHPEHHHVHVIQPRQQRPFGKVVAEEGACGRAAGAGEARAQVRVGGAAFRPRRKNGMARSRAASRRALVRGPRARAPPPPALTRVGVAHRRPARRDVRHLARQRRRQVARAVLDDLIGRLGRAQRAARPAARRRCVNGRHGGHRNNCAGWRPQGCSRRSACAAERVRTSAARTAF